MPASVFSNREGTPPSSSPASTTSGYSSRGLLELSRKLLRGGGRNENAVRLLGDNRLHRALQGARRCPRLHHIQFVAEQLLSGRQQLSEQAAHRRRALQIGVGFTSRPLPERLINGKGCRLARELPNGSGRRSDVGAARTSAAAGTCASAARPGAAITRAAATRGHRNGRRNRNRTAQYRLRNMLSLYPRRSPKAPDY
jgi:hypothetical protein